MLTSPAPFIATGRATPAPPAPTTRAFLPHWEERLSLFPCIRKDTSEGQVIIACCRSGTLHGLAETGRLGRLSGLAKGRHIGGLCCITSCSTHRLDVTVHTECANRIEPAAIVFAGINVDRHLQTLAHLDIELLDAVVTEHLEENLLGILVLGLQYILSANPLTAGA